jgi:hypothetical protein
MGNVDACGVDGVAFRGGVQELLSCSSVSESDVYLWSATSIGEGGWRKFLPESHGESDCPKISSLCSSQGMRFSTWIAARLQCSSDLCSSQIGRRIS